MLTKFDNILKSLGQRELIVPYLENAMLADNWPDSYQVTIDSAPYYGAGDGYFHPSSDPLRPAKALYYRLHPDFRGQSVEERTSMQRQMTLAMGSSLGAIMAEQMRMTGLVKPENIEREYIIEAHHVRGRIDFIVDHPNGQQYVVEMKTMNSYSFKKQAEIKPSWDAQISLGMDAVGIDEGVLLVMESGWPYTLREYFVPKNRVLLDQIYAKFDGVREAIRTNTPPRECCGLNTPEMSSCASRFLCWPKDISGA